MPLTTQLCIVSSLSWWYWYMSMILVNTDSGDSLVPGHCRNQSQPSVRLRLVHWVSLHVKLTHSYNQIERFHAQEQVHMGKWANDHDAAHFQVVQTIPQNFKLGWCIQWFQLYVCVLQCLDRTATRFDIFTHGRTNLWSNISRFRKFQRTLKGENMSSVARDRCSAKSRPAAGAAEQCHPSHNWKARWVKRIIFQTHFT